MTAGDGLDREAVRQAILSMGAAGWTKHRQAVAALLDALEAAEALHRPTDEEIESWADDEHPDEHDRRFPECEAMVRADDALCPGHTYTIQVCQECGYAHNGETPAYRPWPCATLRALRTEGGAS